MSFRGTLLHFECISEPELSFVPSYFYLSEELESVLLFSQDFFFFYTSFCTSTGIKNVCTSATSAFM